jgi:GDP-L-fucose synthase
LDVLNAGLQSKIYVAGHRGLVGGTITRVLRAAGCDNLVLRSSAELDLCDSRAVMDFFERERPEYVFLAAAKVGGILANSSFPAEFIYNNLMIQTNVIHAAYQHPVKKLLFLGSSCIYPKIAPQPIREEYLLTGSLEPTNEPYAVAKIAGIKMCQAYNKQYNTKFICVMPTNLYGPNDNFDLETSHVLPAMIRKFHEAKANNEPNVTLWGTGTPRREFLHVDDLAEACIFLMDNYEENEPINVGTGGDIQISELADFVKKIVGYPGDIKYDTSKPDGTPRKLLDITKINNLGWRAKIGLEEGIRNTYDWYRKQMIDIG